MITIKERENMIHFLVNYFGVDSNHAVNMSDHTLETTYEFAYRRIEMESDF